LYFIVFILLQVVLIATLHIFIVETWVILMLKYFDYQLMKIDKLHLSLLFVCLFSVSFAQHSTNFTQFFVNPYTLNPSFAGADGQKVLSLAYRKQWVGIKESPSVVNLSFHAPAKSRLNYGLLLNNETRGLLSNTGLQGSLAYEVDFGEHRYIRFGLSTGVAMNNIDLSKLDDAMMSDPALANAVENNVSLLGNAGLSFHLKNTHLGFVIPSLFAPTFVSTKSFAVEEVNPMRAIILHGSHRFYFSKFKNVFEPYIVYRINGGLAAQIEAAGVVHLHHTLWFGTSYKQDFGFSVLGGAKLNKLLALGASFSLNNMGVADLNSPSFELQMSYLLGPKLQNVEVYSFVTTTKPKAIKKTAAQLASEKKHQEELAHKKQEEVLAKKQAQATLLQKQAAERDAKLEEEQAKKEAAANTALAKKRADEALALKQAEERTQQALAQQKAGVEKAEKQAATMAKPEEVKQPEQIAVQQTPVKAETATTAQTGVSKLSQPASSGVVTLPPHEDEHGETERIARLEKHDDNPTEHHEEDINAQPHAERHEFVQKGDHMDELDYGDYIVVGVFKSNVNAKHFSDGLVNLNFKADYGHLTLKNLWYVYLLKTKSIQVARAERDKYRKMKMFRDAWLLTVHD
jgi:type IX secretion system PorP/SprF family membrane protein